MGRRLTETIVGHRVLVVVLVLLAIVGAGVGASRLRVDMSSRSFYGAGGSAATVLREYHARWGPDDAELLVLARRSEGRVTDPDARRFLGGVAARLATLDGVTEAWGIGSPPLGLGGAPWPRLLAARIEAAGLVSADGTATILIVTLAHSSDDALATADVVDRVAASLAEAATASDGTWTLAPAGLPAVRAGFVRLAIADQLRLQPLVFGVIALGLVLAYRRLHAVVWPTIAAAIPSGLLAGAMGLAGEPLGLLNQVLLTLLPVIAVADGVHWVARYHEHLRRHTGPIDAAARRAAVADTGATVGRACAWTSLTTAAAFASLMASNMPILRSFGLWGAIGIGLAWASVAVVVPWGLSWSRADAPAAVGGGGGPGRFAVAHARVVSVVGVGLAIAAVVVAARADVDNRLSDLLPPDHPVARANAYVDEALTGTLPLEIEVVAPPDGWNRVTAELVALQNWADDDPQVRTSVGPRDPVGAAQSLRPAEGVARVRLFVADEGGRSFAAFVERVEAQLSGLAAIAGAQVHVTGTVKMAYEGVNHITEDLRVSLVGLLVVVAVAIALVGRRVGWAVASLVVNAWPLALGLGFVSLLGPLDPLAVVIVTIGLGLAVDDTIHLLARIREEGGDTEAIVRATATTGRAVTVTSAILAVGLGLGLLSSFPPLRMLGTLGASVIVAAWLGDLVLLPALLRVAQGGQSSPTGGVSG